MIIDESVIAINSLLSISGIIDTGSDGDLPPISGGWDISSAEYNGDYYDFSATLTGCHDTQWSSDGYILWVLKGSGRTIYEFSVPTPYVVTGATPTGNTFSLDYPILGTATGFHITGDTLQDLYAVTYSPDDMHHFKLASPETLAGSTFQSTLAVGGIDGVPTGLRVASGSVFMVGAVNRQLTQIPMTGWDLSTAVLGNAKSFNTIPYIASPDAIDLGDSGNKIYLASGSAVIELPMLTTLDVDTIDEVNIQEVLWSTYDWTPSSTPTGVTGINFNADGTSFTICDSTNNNSFVLDL